MYVGIWERERKKGGKGNGGEEKEQEGRGEERREDRKDMTKTHPNTTL